MANREAHKIPINKKRFLEILRLRNSSIRKLGEAYKEIQRTEKTIRRYLNAGEMPPELLDKIAKYLDVHPDYLAGVYDQKADQFEDAFLRHLYLKTVRPERYPYLLKARSDINYVDYFESILTMNNISMDQFRTLSADERILLRQEMIVAILEVITRHFSHDSLGNDLSEELCYCESMIGDEDPFSYFAQLEGVGLSEDDIM